MAITARIPKAYGTMAMPDLQARRQQVQQRMIANGGAANSPVLKARYQALNQNIRGMRNQPAATTPPATDTTASTGAMTPATPVQPQDPNVANALFPSSRIFEPQNYEGSPLYQFQKKQGLQDLERLYAARGLTNSGAELEGNSKFLNELGANESDRMMQVAQKDADRLANMQENEANRRFQGQQNAFGNMLDYYRLMSDQNPMRYAYDATNSGAGIYGKMGASDANYAGKNYYRNTVGKTYGGGAGPAPIFNQPFASGPDYSGLNASMALMNPYMNSIYGNVLGGAYTGFQNQ